MLFAISPPAIPARSFWCDFWACFWIQNKVCRKKNIAIPKFEEFWRKGYFEMPLPKSEKIMFEDFRRDPKKFPLNTPSGKIEIFSETISDFKLSDCLGHPSWFEPYEWLGKVNKYPLHLISNQPSHRMHGQLDNASSSQQNKIKGREPIIISKSDADKRKIKNGDIVMVFNNRGKVLAGVHISDKVMKGVVVLSVGAWFDPDYNLNTDRHGSPNTLTKDVGASSLSQAPTSHTTLVEVKKAKKEEISDVQIFKIPDIVDKST